MHRFRHLTATLAALLIVLQAMLPSGWMLSQDEVSGAIRITVCGGGQQDRITWLDLETGALLDETDLPDEAPGDDSSHAPCAFSMLSAFTAPTDTASVDTPLFQRDRAHAPLPADHAYIFSTSPPMPARGPPLQV